MGYRMSRIKRFSVPEWVFAFCARHLQWFSVRAPLKWLLTRNLCEIEERRYNK